MTFNSIDDDSCDVTITLFDSYFRTAAVSAHYYVTIQVTVEAIVRHSLDEMDEIFVNILVHYFEFLDCIDEKLIRRWFVRDMEMERWL